MDTIYVITNPLFPNYIKIGYTKCLYNRLVKLSTSVPEAYKIIFQKKYKNAKKIESRLHSYYRGELLLNTKCISKEWYPIGPREFFDTVEDFIKDIKERIEKENRWIESGY